MAAIYPAFEKQTPELDNAYPAFGGKAAGHALETLDNLAEQLSVTPLSEFIDNRSMAEQVLEEDDPAWEDMPPVQWYPAEQGLACLRALSDYLNGHPDAVEDLMGVRADLQAMENVLNLAQEQAVRFHLLVDI